MYEYFYEDPKYIPCVATKLTEKEVAYVFREGWKALYGVYPENKSLAVLMSQWALETGRGKSCYCWNFGNIKKNHSPDDGHYFTMLNRVNEIINGKVEWFNPPHPQTHFRAFLTAAFGADHYLKFLSQRKRYQKAWQEVINGDPSAYSHELKVAGYYTASEKLYTDGVVKLFNEYMQKIEGYLSAPLDLSFMHKKLELPKPKEEPKPTDPLPEPAKPEEPKPEPAKPSEEPTAIQKPRADWIAMLLAVLNKFWPWAKTLANYLVKFFPPGK